MRIRVTLLVAALAGLSQPPAVAETAPIVPIQPGAQIRMATGGSCSLNFVFDTADTRYIGTAGHCAGVGVRINDSTGLRIGQVEYSVNDYPALDFALIRIDESRLGDVSPAMRYWGGPTGVAPTGSFLEGSNGTKPGTQIRQHGFGTTFRDHELTQRRAGILTESPRTTFEGAIPCSGGDSGSGVILATGEALGVLDVATLALGGLDPTLQSLIGKISPTCGGSTISHVLFRLRAAGYSDIQLVTAPLANPIP